MEELMTDSEIVVSDGSEMPDDPVLAEAWKALMLELESNLREELKSEHDFAGEASLMERDALDALAQDRVPCPVCHRHALSQAKNIIGCVCGMRLPVQVVLRSLSRPAHVTATERRFDAG